MKWLKSEEGAEKKSGWNFRDKHTWLILGLLGVLLLVIALPAEEKESEETSETAAAADSKLSSDVELHLQETLEAMEGVGHVRVMITWKEETEGTSDVFSVSKDGESAVQGILVVAQGGGDSLVRQSILQSLQALFSLEAHKITIVKMSMQEVSDYENF
jgi:stage III sporulation protein AG